MELKVKIRCYIFWHTFGDIYIYTLNKMQHTSIFDNIDVHKNNKN